MEKYLYFGNKTNRSMTFTASTNTTTYRLTTADLIDPLPDGAANTNTIFANGALTMVLTAHGDHTFGTHYGSVSASDLVTVHPEALLYDGIQDVTVATAAADPVYGITLSGTAGNNDATFTLNTPMLAGDANVWPASSFLGVEMVDNDTADIYFLPQTNDGIGNGVDKVRVSYTAGNFKALGEMLNNIINNNRNQSGMVVVADEWSGVYAENNKVGISAVDSITLD